MNLSVPFFDLKLLKGKKNKKRATDEITEDDPDIKKRCPSNDSFFNELFFTVENDKVFQSNFV